MLSRTTRASLGFGAALVLATAGLWVRAREAQRPRLHPAEHQVSTLRDGRRHRYALPLAPRECALGRLTPSAGPETAPETARGLQLEVRASSAERPLRRFDMSRGSGEFGFCVEAPDTYELEVRALARAGGYDLALDAVLARDSAPPAQTRESDTHTTSLSQPQDLVALSPRLRELQDHPEHLETLWSEVIERGTPIIEPLDSERAWVSFVYRGAPSTRAVALSVPIWTHDFAETQLVRMPGTDLWWRSFVLPSDLRLSYQLTIDPPGAVAAGGALLERAQAAVTRADPYNPNVMMPDPALDAYEQRSTLQLPAAGAEPWLNAPAAATPGRVEKRALRSQALGHEHQLTVYVPAEPPEAGGHPLLIFFDGEAYIREIPTPLLLDRLIAARAIPPVVAVFVHNDEPSARNDELPCNDTFAKFVADELLAFMRAQFGTSRERGHNLLAGSSFGGLASSYIALSYADRFGGVLSQSGSYWWSFPPEHPAYDGSAAPGWLRRHFSKRATLPIRFYLSAGSYETAADGTGVLEHNRLQRDALRDHGYCVAYQEFVGGHDPLAWRATLPDALRVLLNAP